MAITDENTVLVLGAGVSAPFGLSLGGDMITTIANSINSQIERQGTRETFGSNFEMLLIRAAQNCSEFSNFPIHGVIAHKHFDNKVNGFQHSDGINADLEKLSKLGELLSDQTSETIDDFIVENPSYAELTKICIATEFFLSSYDFQDNRFKLKPFATRYFDPGGRNWVHLLINIVRQGIRAGSVSPDNKIQIITFNYDMILERVLEQQFSNTEMRTNHYTDYIEVIHMHGQCGELQDLCTSPAEECLTWARGIHVVNENPVPPEIAQERSRAADLIKSAEELYFAGFAFAGPNCRLLELASPVSTLEERTISFCNYDGNVGLSKMVASFENILDLQMLDETDEVHTSVEEASGTTDRPLGVSDWLKLGYLGELPG